MASNFPPSPGYITLDDLEKALAQIKNNPSFHVAPAPQARIVLDNNGETLELGSWIINATSISAQNQLIVKSARTGKVAIIITEDKIIIGNPLKDHIILDL